MTPLFSIVLGAALIVFGAMEATRGDWSGLAFCLGLGSLLIWCGADGRWDE